ncbi:hypothetical protein AKN88_10590 [Thiopseudomonas alkaliphila]|uniref:Omega-protein n=1 Tax=Thiopseudomonas alkaliphila TaxID=1697053 RepID=A0A0K1XGM8_9GAMM|nr:AAA domain-containing protein [Thiopseudomonas alkaliphila]AKX60328.1 hypothetical protein AKN88_10590 [Thiopseudomonas alkaliphila]
MLDVFYKQINFDSMSKLYSSKRIVLPFPEDIESWDVSLTREVVTSSQGEYKANDKYYLLLEFVKRGAKTGYVLLAIPVIVDVPNKEQGHIIYLQPNISESIVLNAEYYLGEHNQQPPSILLNDSALSLDKLSYSLCVGTASTWFESARKFLYNSCAVASLKSLLEKVQTQLKGQEIRPQLSLVNKPSNGAKQHLLKLYEGLLADGVAAYKDTVLPRLLSAYTDNITAVDNTAQDVYRDYLRLARDQYDPTMPYLLGHMDTQKDNAQSNSLADNRELFPLDNTQRHASLAAAYLDTIYADNKEYGRVLAVNGPPGSGKTSMLKAVVAHYVVKAALLKEPCPIIVASGATNQAVKNVTSAFPDVVQDNDDECLLHIQRWIPHCPTYGSFYASKDAIAKLNDKERLVTPILVSVGVDQPYNFGWQGPGEELNDLHSNDVLADYYVQKAQLFFRQKKLPIPSSVSEVVDSLHKMLCAVYADMANAVSVAREQLFNEHADFNKIFPVFLEEEHLSAFITTKQDLISLYQNDDTGIYEKVCRERIRDEKIEPKNYRTILRETALNILIEQCVDLEYRTQLFHLAARYWEGQFIINQAAELHFSRTEENIIAGLRRVCMITPVIISTVNLLPSLLKINSYPPGAVQRSFAYGAIDLLITDESGQATIMGALPLAGLTKRLMSVGDVLQLAPVIDTRTEVSAFDEYLIWLSSGYSVEKIAHIFKRKLAVSEGSFLHVVLAASSLNYQGKGYMLRGHYRCYQSIIEYCNRLVYDNKLFYIPPLNKNQKDEGLPAMAYVESTGLSSAGHGNTSKQNIEEAKMIAQLVVERYQAWKNILGGEESKLRLQDMVAIITPFNKQPEVILKALLEENKAHHTLIPEDEIRNTVINTIHTLQGAEKDIVIYSGVQSYEDGKSLFFEAQPYLLNVAISRAKKSFIAFLCPHLYCLNDESIINDKNYYSSNSVHYLGWYIANFGVRLFPNYLFIVEAPGKLKALRGILKSDYILYATAGLITDTTFEKDSQEVAGKQLRVKYDLLDNGEQALAFILAEGRRVNKIYLATDDDTVGEAIAWHLFQLTKQRAPELVNKFQRVALRAITKDAVDKAIANARTIDTAKVSAEVARAIIDRWLGQRMTHLLRSKLQDERLAGGRKNMGRVRAAILDLLVREEKQLRQRKLSTLNIKLTVNGREIKGVMSNVPEKYIKKIKGKLDKDARVSFVGRSNKYRLVDVENNEVTVDPFNRSTLEIIRLAWQLHGMTPDVTMKILQRLYEGDI